MKSYRRNWLTSAGEISQEVEKFIEDEKNAKKSCFFKLCPNLISRHQLSRQAKKKAEDVKKIQEEIADALGLKFKETSRSGREGRLRERLLKNKKEVLIFFFFFSSHYLFHITHQTTSYPLVLLFFFLLFSLFSLSFMFPHIISSSSIRTSPSFGNIIVVAY